MKTSAQTLLLLVLFSLQAITFSQEEVESVSEETENPGADAFNACDPNNRPEVCTLEYAPVCGYIHNCEGGACTPTFDNNCAACADFTVDGYVNGACEDVKTTCDPDNRPKVCSSIYSPTCAVGGDCQGSRCFEDTVSSCGACRMLGVVYSLPGACPEYDQRLREYCDFENRPNICPTDYTPVCAHLANCVRNSCWSTAGNACSACADENIDFYIPGECPEVGGNNEEGNVENGENEENYEEYEEIYGEGYEEEYEEEYEGFFVFCDVDLRPEACPADGDPVCAHIRGCPVNNADCARTAANGCEACSQADVDYYFQAECLKIRWNN